MSTRAAKTAKKKAAPPRGDELLLPHERDQDPTDATAPQPDPLIEQARRDIESGQVDTDLHNTPGLDAERRRELLRKGKG